MTRKFLVPVQLPADPANPLEAATKQYVDARATPTRSVIAVSADRSLALTDKDNILTVSDATLTVPTDASVNFPVPTQIDIVCVVPNVSVVEAGGVSVTTAASLNLRTEGSAATLVKLAANTWVLVGDLEAAAQMLMASMVMFQSSPETPGDNVQEAIEANNVQIGDEVWIGSVEPTVKSPIVMYLADGSEYVTAAPQLWIDVSNPAQGVMRYLDPTDNVTWKQMPPMYQMPNGAVTTPKIADGAVTQEKLAPGVPEPAPAIYVDATIDWNYLDKTGIYQTAYRSNNAVSHGPMDPGEGLLVVTAGLPVDDGGGTFYTHHEQVWYPRKLSGDFTATYYKRFGSIATGTYPEDLSWTPWVMGDLLSQGAWDAGNAWDIRESGIWTTSTVSNPTSYHAPADAQTSPGTLMVFGTWAPDQWGPEPKGTVGIWTAMVSGAPVMWVTYRLEHSSNQPAWTKIFPVSATLPDASVTNAKLANMALNTVKGVTTAGPPTDLSTTTLTSLVNTFGLTLKGLVPAPGSPATGRVLKDDGTWALPSSPPPVDVQIYGTPGTFTWTKPAGAKLVQARLIGGGGGGGSGRRGAAASVRCGGGGGGGAALTDVFFNPSDLPASLSVQVGAGGTGGPAVAADSTNGTAGQGGTDSTMYVGGTYYARAYKGNGGGAGSTSAGTGGSAGAGTSSGTPGANSSSTGTNGSNSMSYATAGAISIHMGGGIGGSGGGGISAADAAGVGGWNTQPAYLGGGIGGVVSYAVASPAPGASGQGGAASLTAAGAAGTDGGRGCGGGGGAASLNGFASGAGGKGGDGIVMITTYF